MQHFSHKHSLILNEIYHAKKGDMCYGCNEQIISCRLFVYSCINSSTTASTSNVDNECHKFLLHRSCVELPLEIQNPKNQEEFLFLKDGHHVLWSTYSRCAICHMQCKWFSYRNRNLDFFACVKCAMFDHEYDHPAHPLTLVQHLASFRCYACKVDDNIKDLSYMCTNCPFWVHKNCADAPTSFQFQFHNQHPLILSFSIPQIYRKFVQYCKLCNEELSWLDWLYYCPNCRFFAHFHCARSNQMLSTEEEMYGPDLVHLPAADESAVNLLCEQFIKALSSLNHNDDNSMYSAAKGIKHWSHDEHDLQLITTNELSEGKDDDDDEETLLLCDGCVKPIRSDGGVLYGCVRCKYFLHKVCAELSRDIKYDVWAGSSTLSAHKYNEPYECFSCQCCAHMCNGIYFRSAYIWETYDIGCVSLPNIIKHEAHPHQLNQIKTCRTCKACGTEHTRVHRCERCDFNICGSCIMKPRTHKHLWDRHPLQLIYDPGMVSEHEAEYNCEFCSQDIDTNEWFYHCSDCDLSFHVRDKCFERSCNYLDLRSKIKFGASDIKFDKLHPHSLTFVFNKKVRSCERCRQPQLGKEVLECAPCKAIFCSDCNRNQNWNRSRVKRMNRHWNRMMLNARKR